WRETNLHAHGRVVRHRQQLAEPPHALGARLDGGPRQRFLDALVIIDYFERAEVEFANVRRGERILPATFAALQRPHKTFVSFHSHFAPARPGWVRGRLPWRLRASPSAILDEAIISTDADRLIHGR